MQFARLEDELLARCSCTQLETAQAERVNDILNDSLDWDYIWEQAVDHHVLPSIFHSLDAAHLTGRVPEGMRQQLETHFERNTRRNLLLISQLLKVLEIFEANGVAAIPLKGPVFALTAYGNLALRQAGDLDVLIRPQDMATAQRLLVDIAYKLDDDPTLNLPLQHSYHHRFIESTHDSIIELHWALGKKSFHILSNPEFLWQSSTEIEVFNRRVLIPSPEEQLLFLSMHLAKHSWSKLFWLNDIVELLRSSPNMDWNYVLEQATQRGGKRILLLALLLAEEVFEIGIVKPSLVEGRDNQLLQPFLHQISTSLFSHVEQPDWTIQKYLLEVQIRMNTLDRLRYAKHVLNTGWKPTARDYAVIRLPKYLSFLYYIIRIFRLSSQYVLPWHRSRKSRK